MEFLDYVRSISLRLPGDAWEFFEVKAWVFTAIGLVITYSIAKWKRDDWKMQEVKKEAWNVLTATLTLCGVILLFLLFIYSPYQQYKQLQLSSKNAQDELKKYQSIGEELKDAKAQWDEAIKQQKLLEEAMDIQNSEIGKLRRELGDARRQLDDKKASMAEKVDRNALKENIGVYLYSSEIVKENCVKGLIDSPIKAFLEWNEHTLRELGKLKDPSYLVRFQHTPPPAARGHYEIGGKPVSEECNRIFKLIEIKQAELKKFMAELSR